MYQTVQLAGSCLVLLAFVMAQRRRWAQNSTLYLLANIIGSGILAVTAVLSRSWGFLLLEGSWCVLSTFSLSSDRSKGLAKPEHP